jgi:CheY-like chemotaxis protein
MNIMARLPHPLPPAKARGMLDLARVLLVHGDLAPRLALQTILQAGGYRVDVAATPAEALIKLDEHQYELVLSDGKFGSSEEGRNVLAYARVKSYQPATALITSPDSEVLRGNPRGWQQVAVYTENLPALLAKVAELIGLRAIRRYRPLRQAV